MGTALVSMWFDRRLQNERLLQRLYADLQEREVKIRRLINTDVIGILQGNLEGRIIDANEAFLQMVGYNREDLASGNTSGMVRTGRTAFRRTKSDRVSAAIREGVFAERRDARPRSD
jgi:PAS domain S-box-containing protein